MAIRVLLVDDHIVVRQGLKALLAGEPDMAVVGEAGDGRTAAQLAQELLPDVIVMDVAMPGMNGAEATREIAAKAPDARIVALTMYADRRFVGEMLRAGARGYVQKGCSFEEVAQAIRMVASGHRYLSAFVAEIVAKDYGNRLRREEATGRFALTPREREMLRLLAEGNTPKEIATAFGVSVKTVSSHRRSIMLKLGIGNTAGLIKYAIREGLTSSET